MHNVIRPTDIVSHAFENLNSSSYDLDKPIYVDSSNPANFISARKARRQVRELASGWLAKGIQRGDCVCLHAYNNIHYPVLWLGIIGAGGCVSGSNPSYSTFELIHHFQTSHTRFVVTQAECLSNIIEAARECGIPASNVFVLAAPGERAPEGYQKWETLLGQGECDWVSFEDDDTKAQETVAALSSTSGTSGLPKAAIISHRYMVAQSVMIEESDSNRPQQVPAEASPSASLTEMPQISQLVCLPLFHAFAAQVGLILPLRTATTTYFMERFKLQPFVENIEKFAITDTFVVPPMITALLRSGHSSTGHGRLESLRYVICAGAPIDAHVQSKLYGLLSNAVVAQCWGTTETGWVTVFSRHEKDTSGSVGRLLPYSQLRIVAENGKIVTDDNIRGEAYIRSPSLFSGYLANPEANATAFCSDGFYKTGDCVFLRDGKAFIDGRMKDIIKVNAFQVSPAELESIILQHPRVADVAVIGVARVDKGGLEESVPLAFVVRRSPELHVNGFMTPCPPSSTKTPQAMPLAFEAAEIQAFVATKVVSYKRLTGGVRFVDSIPRSGTGKILRRLLEEELGEA